MKLFEYVFEGGKNYIQTEEAGRGDYISEMLIHNNIAGFVGARLKSRNGENYIVYPISGLVPLTQLVEIKKLSTEAVEVLIRAFIKVMQSMDDYLLPIDRLIIEPEHIYQNYGKKDEFLWIYGGEKTRGGSIISLFEFLMDKVDHRDDRAVSLIYTLYQSCKDFQLMEAGVETGSMLSMICEKGGELLATKENVMEALVKKRMEAENTYLGDEEDFFKEKNPMIVKELSYQKEWEGETERKKTFRTEANQDGLGKPFQSKRLFGIENKNLRNETLKQGLFSHGEKKKKSKKREEKGKLGLDKPSLSSKSVTAMFQKAWNYLNADIGSSEENSTLVEEAAGDYKLRDVKVIKVSAEESGEKATTLLTNGIVNSGVYCLKPFERGEEAVLITSYPFFIGKADVDIQFKMEDSTVSRYHCRIDRDEEGAWLTDLGSTNGTFLNGTRLLPFERLHIEERDTIVISRKKYEFSFMN